VESAGRDINKTQHGNNEITFGSLTPNDSQNHKEESEFCFVVFKFIVATAYCDFI